jgi:hypothetical protein
VQREILPPERILMAGCTPKVLWASYRSALAKHPVKTQALTTAVLWAVGDLLSQLIEGTEVRGVIDFIPFIFLQMMNGHGVELRHKNSFIFYSFYKLECL